MGKYINPPVSEYGIAAKESWIIQQITMRHTATEVKVPDLLAADWDEIDSRGKVLLVMIDNGSFTALGVLDTEHELAYWKRNAIQDKRRKWFLECDKEAAYQYAH